MASIYFNILEAEIGWLQEFEDSLAYIQVSLDCRVEPYPETIKKKSKQTNIKFCNGCNVISRKLRQETRRNAAL